VWLEEDLPVLKNDWLQMREKSLVLIGGQGGEYSVPELDVGVC
jgi:hypothetical protein